MELFALAVGCFILVFWMTYAIKSVGQILIEQKRIMTMEKIFQEYKEFIKELERGE